MLSLQAKGTPFFVGLPAFSLESPVEVISSVELNAGLGRPGFHNTARFWIVNRGH